MGNVHICTTYIHHIIYIKAGYTHIHMYLAAKCPQEPYTYTKLYIRDYRHCGKPNRLPTQPLYTFPEQFTQRSLKASFTMSSGIRHLSKYVS